MTVSLLNLDSTFPVADSFHASNTSGVIRYMNSSDANGLQAMQRYMGDAFNRSRLIEAKINSLITSFNSNPYTSGFDDRLYIKSDGSNPLTGALKGVTPTSPEHITTKAYVDGAITAFQSSLTSLSSRVDGLEARLPLTRVSDWVEYVWSAGTKTLLTFDLSPSSSDLSNVVMITLVERLNLGTPEEPNYVYMQYCGGNSTNFKVDAMWLDDTDSDKLNVLVPNDVNYPSDYPSSGYNDLQNFSQRHLRAIVTHATGACA
jgi:hypothetical protein